MAPTGWQLRQQVSQLLIKLDKIVTKHNYAYKDNTLTLNPRFLARLTPNSPMERSNYFVEVKAPNENLTDILYRPNALCEKELSDPLPSEILIRRERQTFRRLPRTGAIVFGVKTYLTPLDELPMTELDNLAKEMRSWPDYVGDYKGRDVWGAKVLEYYQKRVGEIERSMGEKQDQIT